MSFLRFPTIGKIKRRKYDPSLLSAAYDAVRKDKISVCKAAKLFGVPESTLRDRTLGLQPVPESGKHVSNPGPIPVFSREEEGQLLNHISYMSNIGYGYSKKEFLNLSTDFAISLKKKSETDPIFSNSWYKSFKSRNPDLSLTKPQKLSVVRAKATSQEVIDEYFSGLEHLLDEHGITDKPNNIWNIDETGIVMEHTPTNILCLKGSKPQAVTSNRGKNVTIIAGGNAAGVRIPPYYVFPGKRWNSELLEGSCPGSSGTVTESGWSNSLVFMDYLENHFLKYVPTNSAPVLVLFDGHRSHVNLTLRDWGKAHNIIFYLLPPHTSHVTQPLDVGCFGPLKRAYNSECQAYMRKHPGMQINRYNVAQISSKAYNKGLTPENLISSFRRTGIYPLERCYIPQSKTLPATIYNVNDESDDENKENTFLESRKITKTVELCKKRKAKQSITGNLMSPGKSALLKEIVVDIQDTPKKAKIIRNTPTQKQSKSKIKTQINKQLAPPEPSTSGVKATTPKNVHEYSDSDLDSLNDEDPCCVCQKRVPDSANFAYTLEIINWGQCDLCQHWVHLKYCTSVRVLRRNDKFLCPHCEK